MQTYLSRLASLVLFSISMLQSGTTAIADEIPTEFQELFANHCADCHADGAEEGGLDLDALRYDLVDEASFARWERIFDRIDLGEMPPEDAEPLTDDLKGSIVEQLGADLTQAHAQSKGTVLRRLNRREYQNTLNDMFGTNLELGSMLPEDGKTHEFDNIGNSLGLSMVHLQRYIDAFQLVLDNAIAKTTEAPEAKQIIARYHETREAEQFVGKVWKKLEDNAVVRFAGGGYPSGMLRGSGVRERGRFRVKVTGYAHQSDEPIIFSVGGTSFARGSEKPIYGFWEFPPGAPGRSYSIEFETWIDRNYMIQIEPVGISDPERYQRKSIDGYTGPGLAILEVTLEGPLHDEFPTRGHRLLFDGVVRREIPPRNPNERNKSWYKPQFEIIASNEERNVGAILQRLATAAFRQPVSESEVTRYVELFETERVNGADFEDALRTTSTALFCSPRFLFLQEPAGRLDGHALASRLSYFLTRTSPDAQLLAAAADGSLTRPDVLRAHTERLLNDPKFERFIVDFCDSWLDLREMDFTAPDSALYPEFDLYLRHSMPLETRGFLRELIESNRGVENIVKSDFAMLNSRLADHYGLPPISGTKIRSVKLPDESLRGGFLTQASILKVTANGTNSSPVTRGAWVLERILAETPPPPPPGIPGVEPDVRGASTLRELLDKHRDVVSCKNCHESIDPPGFALEEFNPIGGHRERYRSLGEGDRVEEMVLGRRVRYRLGPDVDSSGMFPDGTPFQGYREFRDHLASDRDRLAATLITKLATFASGRELGFSDRTEVERLVKESAENGHGFRDLFHLVVQSEIFRHK